jgi:predicted membrane channel-forming protein YqfA (hemolysin III family)
MKLSTFAIIVTILAALFGLAFVFIPAQMATFYGLSQDPAALWTTRYFGASLLFIAMIYWSYSHESESAKSWPKLLQFSIIYDLIQMVLTATALLSGVGNTHGWSSVVLYAVLAMASLYYLGVCKKARAGS